LDIGNAHFIDNFGAGAVKEYFKDFLDYGPHYLLILL
jgi:hypothetical protein